VGALASLGLLAWAVPAAAAPHYRIRPQIVGGQPAPPGSLPQLAYVQYQGPPGQSHSCTGTVVSPKLVLTAGHCVQDEATGDLDPAAGFLVATGRLSITDSSTGQVGTVANVIPYPYFNPTTHDHDAALLELTAPTTAPAMALANVGDSSLSQPGTAVEIAGWGLTNGSEPYSQPSQLQWATTLTQSATYCAQEAGLVDVPFDASGQLCTLDTPTDATSTCNGDSGGPLIADYATADPVEIGITTWGGSNSTTDCDAGFPDFFTRADSISTWVSGWINELVPAPTPTPTPTSNPNPPSARTPPVAEPGTYRGVTSQHMHIKLTVTSAGRIVSRFKVNYRLRCANGRRPASVQTIDKLSISNMRFGRKLVHGHGPTDKVAGTFNATGRANGTIGITWLNSRNGSCHAGPIHWTARR
jgi:secreted trypsin-like serine protease